MAGPELHTERLVLRRWRDDDRPTFAAINTDPAVTATLRHPLSRAESDAFIDRTEAEFDARGFGLWAVDVPGIATCIGFVGLSVPRFEAPFTPCVEIGWRLASSQWGNGYATEGARAVVDFAFATLGVRELVSFTAATNQRSRAVMERLGMSHDPHDDFIHPNLEPDHPLASHVLYRLT